MIFISKHNYILILLFSVLILSLSLFFMSTNVANAGINWDIFSNCYGSPATGDCAKADFNGDGTVGAADFHEFITAIQKYNLTPNWITFSTCYGSPAIGDCAQVDFNGDGTIGAEDLHKLVIGLSIFSNCNGSPATGVCAGIDFDGNGVIGETDFHLFWAAARLHNQINNWKIFSGCYGSPATGVCAKADFNGDGTVGAADLNELIQAVQKYTLVNPPPRITVKSPNGGETLNIGEKHRVSWDSTNNINVVSVGWSAVPGQINWIAKGIPNNGYYDWNVDVGKTGYTQFKVFILGYDNRNIFVIDGSDNFFKVAINMFISQCSDGIDNDGDGYIDYPEDVGCNSEGDDSELGLATITSFSSSITPDGSLITQQWSTSEPANITLALVCPVGNKTRELTEYKGGGKTFACPNPNYNLSELVIYSRSASDGLSYGGVTLTSSDDTENIEVQFKLTLKNGAYSESRTSTVIIPPQGDVVIIPAQESVVKSITVKSPNGGEIYNQGDVVQITWDSSGLGDLWISISVKSKDDTISGHDIANPILNSGSYFWTIPDNYLNGEYKILIGSADKGPSAQDYSDDNFTIGTVVSSPTIYTPSQVVVNVIFTQNLWIGMTHNDVRRLQELLARDAQLYPSGIISGYYGGLTQTAIQRFQCKYNIVCSGASYSTGYGLVGPRTLVKLNEVYGGNSTNNNIPSSTTDSPTQGSSGLSQPQINAIIMLLEAFGADASTIANVRAVL